MLRPGAAAPVSSYRGLVGGRRFAAAFLAVVDFLTTPRFFAAGLFLIVLVVPEDTRVECFGR